MSLTEWITTRTDIEEIREHASETEAVAYAAQAAESTGHPVNVWKLERFVEPGQLDLLEVHG